MLEDLQTDELAWGILVLLEDEEQEVFASQDEALAFLCWRTRRYDLYCELMAEKIANLTRIVVEGTDRLTLVGALEQLISAQETVRSLRKESSDHPGIPKVVAAIDQLESALAKKGLAFRDDGK